jgi:hypothetical protein
LSQTETLFSFLGNVWPLGSQVVRTFTYDTVHNSATANCDALTGDSACEIPCKTNSQDLDRYVNGVFSHGFTYDPALNLNHYSYCAAPANPLSPPAVGDTSSTFTANFDDQIGGGWFVFDPAGGPTTYNDNALSFDSENRPTATARTSSTARRSSLTRRTAASS